MNPPLAKPGRWRHTSKRNVGGMPSKPFSWTRRIETACETAQVLKGSPASHANQSLGSAAPGTGRTLIVRFDKERQKLFSAVHVTSGFDKS